MRLHNKKWYFLCNLQAKVALQYMQIPQVWGMATGLNDESCCTDDETLANLDWSPTKGVGFLLPEAAAAQGISPVSMQIAKENAQSVVQESVREIRDTILGYTDIFVLADRWESYSAEDQKAVANYRQALRDVTNQDPFNVVWPEIPGVLSGITASVKALF